MTKQYFRKILVLLLSSVLLLTAGIMPLSAEEASALPPAQTEEPLEPPAESMPTTSSLPTYLQYLSENPSTPARDTVNVDVTAYTADSSSVTATEQLDGRTAVLTQENGTVSWEVSVPADGLYILQVDFRMLAGNGGNAERHLLIDGRYPFKEARFLKFSRLWEDEIGTAAFDRDGRDNELRPTQVEKVRWQQKYLTDAIGYYKDPLAVYLTAGVHVLSLESVKEPLALSGLTLEPVKSVKDYAAYAAQYVGKTGASNQNIMIEAEHASEKSDVSIYAQNDRSSPINSPQSASKIRLNTIGGSKWQTVGQRLTWDFHVEQAGYYTITLRCKQAISSGRFSTRSILIDGEVPFSELENVRFAYDGGWQMVTVGDGEEAYRLWLEPGDHTISMEVVLGDIAAIVERADNWLTRLNAVYRQLLMIIGSSPDIYRDYNFTERVPEVLEELAAVADELESVVDGVVEISGSKGEGTALLNQIIFQLCQMAEKPETRIAADFGAFKSNISSLGSWIISSKNQPLLIDYIQIHTEDVETEDADCGFFKKLWFELKAFFATFFNDYDSVGDINTSKDALLVWLSSGRDQAAVLKQMAEDSFTPKTGIPVNIQLVAAGSLLPSALAGIGPDVSIDASSVIDYGVRGALLDISDMPGFREIVSRFHESAWVPYQFNGAVYGVPQTQSFSMMFYRTDIFEELGLQPPKTWQDFYGLLSILQNNNMEIGFPIGGTAGTLMFMYQNGAELYRDNGAEVALDTDIALAAFQRTCELFTKRSFPVSYDFANRFKTGEMPIGIADYTFYNQLEVFAPEIKGLWSFELIPGTVREDGTVDHSIKTAGAATVIMSGCKNPKEAWEFVKWWTDAEAQSRYAREIESILGASAKYATANIQAFKQISTWTAAESDKILEQWDWCVGTPDVPGGYYVSRCIEFAFNRVYSLGDNAVESLQSYLEEINNELTRKRREFGLPTAKKGE